MIAACHSADNEGPKPILDHASRNGMKMSWLDMRGTVQLELAPVTHPRAPSLERVDDTLDRMESFASAIRNLRPTPGPLAL